MKLKEIKERCDLRYFYPKDRIVGEWQPFDGKWISAKCIFHDDNDSSASISRYGFVCHQSDCRVTADLFGFVMLSENVSMAKAVRQLT